MDILKTKLKFKEIMVDRFYKKIIFPKILSDCWIFNGYNTHNGYGRFWEKEFTWRAHRYVWNCFFGAIPEGMNVLHKCDNPPCCNPNHLKLGTQAENLKDRDNKNRQACGEQNGLAKLTLKKVIDIRAKRLTGLTYRKLASMYDVSFVQIGNIIRCDCWKTLLGVPTGIGLEK